jgi:hypothetical protein
MVMRGKMRVILGGMATVMVLIMRKVVLMSMAAAFIGAAFRIERRLDLDHAGAQTRHHGLDDVIPADPQSLCHGLRRQMPVAEMPGDADQVLRIAPPDLEQRLGSRDDLDQPPILQNQRITAAQRHGVFEVEQEFEAARAGHRHPPPVAIVKVEDDRVGGGLLPAMLRLDLCGADHAINLNNSFQNFSTLPSLTISITVGAARSGVE